MDYNKGYELKFPGYHKATGCINFPQEQWENWYGYWINNKPISYYAYIMRDLDKQFIGEVNLHYNSKHDWYDMGIVFEGKYRGQGYSKQALYLLLEIAFEKYSAKAVHNDFENTREKAYKLHIDAGFKIIRSSSDIVDLVILKSDFTSIKNI
jgi:diamine N-acetyltransferase